MKVVTFHGPGQRWWRLGPTVSGDFIADGGGDGLVDFWEVTQQVLLMDWMWNTVEAETSRISPEFLH